MLVKQKHCPIQPQLTISPAPHNRLPEWNIQRSIERQFAQARKAWARYQSTRQRDAIYGYLSVVFEIVQRWKMFGNVKAYSVHALTDANRRGKTGAGTLTASPFFARLTPGSLMRRPGANGPKHYNSPLEPSLPVSRFGRL